MCGGVGSGEAFAQGKARVGQGKRARREPSLEAPPRGEEVELTVLDDDEEGGGALAVSVTLAARQGAPTAHFRAGSTQSLAPAPPTSTAAAAAASTPSSAAARALDDSSSSDEEWMSTWPGASAPKVEKVELCEEPEEDGGVGGEWEDDRGLRKTLVDQLLSQESDDEGEEEAPQEAGVELMDEAGDDPSAELAESASAVWGRDVLPRSVRVRYGPDLPSFWPSPLHDDYQDFLEAYFTGRGHEAAGHDWSTELAACAGRRPEPAGMNEDEGRHVLSAWQAAGYLHARKVLASPECKGCMYYWTPGSGKSIMVALLLDALYDSDLAVYVVSSPQNIRQNDLACCARALLKFSPRFKVGDREPRDEEVAEMVSRLRRRPRGPPVFKRNFMSFREFANFCQRDGCEGTLRKAAVIIDESHLLFDEKRCPRVEMWGQVLETLTRSSDSKVFTLTGTPGRDRRELLLQLELVRHAHDRVDHAQLLGDSAEADARMTAYCKGRISFVDGTCDRSRYPAHLGLEEHMCCMGLEQLANFSGRVSRQLRAYGAKDVKSLLSPLRGAVGGPEWKAAVFQARLMQAASTAYTGGPKNGMRSLIQGGKSVLLADIGRFSGKFRTLIEAVLSPPTGSDPLRIRHFVYSSNAATISAFAEVLQAVVTAEAPPRAVKSEGGDHAATNSRRRFRRLRAEELVWCGGRKGSVRLAPGARVEAQDQLVFVVLQGSSDDKQKLLRAFGQISPDGVRSEGLFRADGRPLVQLVVGTHESNQGLTFLRVQHVHLLEPNPRGWSEVIQATGRAVRRYTHIGLPDDIRAVRTHLYMTVLGEEVESIRKDQLKKAEDELSALLDDWQDAKEDLSDDNRDMSSRDFADHGGQRLLKIMQKILQGKLKELSNIKSSFEDTRSRIDSLHSNMVEVAVGPPLKSTGEPRKYLVETWAVMPDQAVHDATWRDQQEKERVEAVMRASSVHARLLSSLHGDAARLGAGLDQAQLRFRPWSKHYDDGTGRRSAAAAPAARSRRPAAAGRGSEQVVGQVPSLLSLLEREAPVPMDRTSFDAQVLRFLRPRPGGDTGLGSLTTCWVCQRSSRKGVVMCGCGHAVCARCSLQGLMDRGGAPPLPCPARPCGQLIAGELLEKAFAEGSKGALQALQVMKKRADRARVAGGGERVPPEWEWGPGGEREVRRVPLADASIEYKKVVARFRLTCARAVVVGVERVQNLAQWEMYRARRAAMGGGGRERTLFHGTHPGAVDSIVSKSFNRSYCGRNGTAFGQGVYFARDASYSAQATYASPDAVRVQSMFVVRVMVGRVARGAQGMVAPPEGYDTTGDNEDNPGIIVVYHDAQAYPAYLIRFRA